jgi:signal transduction histidine kinase
MEIWGMNKRPSSILAISIFLVLLLIFVVVIYLLEDDTASKLSAFTCSLAAGLVVAIIQLIIAWRDYSQNEELRKLQLLEILYDRDSRTKYEAYIRKSKRNIDVMGVTAARFFSHFADTDMAATENAKVLLNAMGRNVKVRILLPSDQFLPSDTKRQDANRVREQYRKLKESYPDNIEIRYFDHTSAHSIFRIDDTCIIGPVFPRLESKYTPALHVMKSSPMALNYMDYFETEWKDAEKE